MHNGSIQKIPGIPYNIKAIYKTLWEISQKNVLDLAAPHSHHPPDQIHIMVTKTRPSSVGASPLTSSHVQSTPYILGLKHKTPTLHCLRSAPDETTIIRDLHIP